MWGAGGLLPGKSKNKHLGIKGLEMPLKHTLNLSPWMAVTLKTGPPFLLCPQADVRLSLHKQAE